MEGPNGPFKKMPEVVVTEQDITTSRVTASRETKNDTWVPSPKNRMPYFGFAALFVTILASVGQMIVLLVADNKSASDWIEYLTPNVCLSILNGIASLAITFAVMQGIAIAWWRRALAGASIKELHYTWNFSTSVSTIFLKFRYFNAIALAALMTKVAIVDGVLFQRAIGTYIKISWDQVPKGSPGDHLVHAWSQEKFPFTGVMGAENANEGQTSYWFSYTIMDWITRGSGIYTGDSVDYCYGVACDYGLPGAGFEIDCEMVNSTDLFVNNTVNGVGPNSKNILDVNFELLYPDAVKNYSRIGMNATWPMDDRQPDADGNWPPAACPTLFTIAQCELRPAVMNYTVWYTNSSSIERSKLNKKPMNESGSSDNIGESGSQLGYSCEPRAWNSDRSGSSEINATQLPSGCRSYNTTLKQIMGVEVNHTFDIYEPWIPHGNSSLLGIYNALKDQYTTHAELEYTNGTWSVSQTGYLAPYLMGFIPEKDTFCNYTYGRPQEQIFQRLNELMLQTSLDRGLSPESEYDPNADYYPQHVHALQYFKDIYYQTDKIFMGCALGLTVLVIICILPSYWGFWQLGRDVTLGPFEIAYAFQGPAFSAVHGVDGRAEEVVKTIGKTNVQYGEVEDGDGKRLAFKMMEVPSSRAR